MMECAQCEGREASRKRPARRRALGIEAAARLTPFDVGGSCHHVEAVRLHVHVRDGALWDDRVVATDDVDEDVSWRHDGDNRERGNDCDGRDLALHLAFVLVGRGASYLREGDRDAIKDALAGRDGRAHAAIEEWHHAGRQQRLARVQSAGAHGMDLALEIESQQRLQALGHGRQGSHDCLQQATPHVAHDHLNGHQSWPYCLRMHVT